MTIELLPGVKLSAKLLLAKLLEGADEIESVMVVIHGKNGYVKTAFSHQELRDLTIGLKHLEERVRTEIMTPPGKETEEAS